MKHLLLMISALCLSSNVLAKVTYEDAVKSSEDFYRHNNAVNIPPSQEGLSSSEKQDTSGSNLVRKTLLKISGGIPIGEGRPIRLRENIDNYVQLILTYQLAHEGPGVHTKTMTISTALWRTDPSHTRTEPLYRFTDTSGADKDRWSTINFWRTGPQTLYTTRNCDRYCSVNLVAVEGIK